MVGVLEGSVGVEVEVVEEHLLGANALSPFRLAD